MTVQGEYRRWLHEKGRCVDCKQRDAYTLNGRHRCFECNEKQKQRQTEYRKAGRREKENAAARKRNAERKSAGLCVQCGKSTNGNGKARCAHCLEVNRRAAERQHRKKNPDVNLPRGDNGFCFLCNKNTALIDKKVCQTCYETLCGLTAKLNAKPRDNSGHIWRKQDHAAAVSAKHKVFVPVF